MPFKPKRKTYRKKINVPKRKMRVKRGPTRTNNKYYSVVRVNRNIVPSVLMVPLTYVSEKLTFTTTGGIERYNLFNINSLYDPDRTGIGHQPLGYDQLSALYNNYRVLGSSIRVWARNDTDSTPFKILISTSSNTSGPAGIDAAQEGRVKTRMGGDQGKVMFVKAYRKMPTVFGVTKEQYLIEKDYGADVGSNPVNCGIWQVWVEPFDESSTIGISVKVEITYYARFTSPKWVIQS